MDLGLQVAADISDGIANDLESMTKSLENKKIDISGSDLLQRICNNLVNIDYLKGTVLRGQKCQNREMGHWEIYIFL